MSIEHYDEMYYLHCDHCGTETDETFDDFYDAVEAKKELGWQSRKYGFWEDWCPDCIEEERADRIKKAFGD